MMILAFLIAYSGFSSIAFSMQRHHRQIRGAAPTRRQALMLKIAGWLMLAGSFPASLAAWGPVYGSVVWLGVLSASALCFTFILSFRPRAAAALTLCAPVFAALSLLWR